MTNIQKSAASKYLLFIAFTVGFASCSLKDKLGGGVGDNFTDQVKQPASVDPAPTNPPDNNPDPNHAIMGISYASGVIGGRSEITSSDNFRLKNVRIKSGIPNALSQSGNFQIRGGAENGQ